MSKNRKPELMQLSGASYSAYQAGEHIGYRKGLTDAAANIFDFKRSCASTIADAIAELPESPAGDSLKKQLQDIEKQLGYIAGEFTGVATQHQAHATEHLANLALATSVKWWKSERFVGWLGYVAAVSIASAVAVVTSHLVW